jgi:hypothetical protein
VLLEMARWQSAGWAYDARIMLARISDIPEDRARVLAFGDRDAFLAAIGRK